jgi:hypothetical protein
MAGYHLVKVAGYPANLLVVPIIITCTGIRFSFEHWFLEEKIAPNLIYQVSGLTGYPASGF